MITIFTNNVKTLIADIETIKETSNTTSSRKLELITELLNEFQDENVITLEDLKNEL